VRGCRNEEIVDKLPASLTREGLLNDRMLQAEPVERSSSASPEMASSASVEYGSSRRKRTSRGYTDREPDHSSGNQGRSVKRACRLASDTVKPAATASSPNNVKTGSPLRAGLDYRRQEYHLDDSDSPVSTGELEETSVGDKGAHTLSASSGELASGLRPAPSLPSGADTVIPGEHLVVAESVTKDELQRRAVISQRVLGTTFTAGKGVIPLPFAEVATLMATDLAQEAGAATTQVLPSAPLGSVAGAFHGRPSNDQIPGEWVPSPFLFSALDVVLPWRCDTRQSRKWQTLHRRRACPRS
jgi:hypothetical protein